MFVMLSGIVTDVISEQPEKAKYPMDVTFFPLIFVGISISFDDDEIYFKISIVPSSSSL